MHSKTDSLIEIGVSWSLIKCMWTNEFPIRHFINCTNILLLYEQNLLEIDKILKRKVRKC